MLRKIREFLKKYRHACVLLGMAGVFFIGASAFNFFTQQPDFYWGSGREFIKWSSPDETANYTAAKLFAQEGQLSFFEKYNLLAKDIIHPRSFRSDLGWIKPVSFLGLPIYYGYLASFAGYELIPYLTPLIGALGIIFFYLLIREIFAKDAALLSAVFLTFFPAYIYYSSRSMFHNVGFTVFLAASLYFFAKAANSKEKASAQLETAGRSFRGYLSRISLSKLIFGALSGLFLGAAVAFRSSELVWVFPLYSIIALASIKSLHVYLLNIPLFALIVLLPILAANTALFGSPLSGGYPEMNSSIYELSEAGNAALSSGVRGNFAKAGEIISAAVNVIFHFGVKIGQSAKLFKAYFVDMFYWYFWPAAAGLLFFLARPAKSKRRQWAYLAAYAAASAILVIYYGSWEFYDNPDKLQQTIGNSYTRYWLPVYLGSFPFAALPLVRFYGWLKKAKGMKIASAAFIVSLLAGLALLSLNFAAFGSDEGLYRTALKNMAGRQEFNRVMELTENNAVIITRYHDKIFFPERKVIVGEFDDPNMLNEYKNISRYLPVYYYNFSLPDESVKYLNERKFKEIGLTIEKIEAVNNDFTLYRLESAD